jgi:hypothetical protein
MSGQTCIGLQPNGLVDNFYWLAGMMASSYFLLLCRGCRLITRRSGGIFFNPVTMRSRLKLPGLSSEHEEKIYERVKQAFSQNRDLNPMDVRLIDSILNNYLRFGKEETITLNYTSLLLSSYLHPDNLDIDRIVQEKKIS